MTELSRVPRRRLAVLTCMDARIDPAGAFGLEIGDAHVLRNAGGMVTDDVARSLELSRGLGVHEVAVVGHTDCAVFPDALVEDAVRDGVRAVEGLGFERVTGYVYDVRTGRVTPLEAA